MTPIVPDGHPNLFFEGIEGWIDRAGAVQVRQAFFSLAEKASQPGRSSQGHPNVLERGPIEHTLTLQVLQGS